MKSQTARKLRRQAEYAGKGKILDVGISANPNPYLENVIGLDIVLPQQKPSNYLDMVRCNLNKESIPFEDGTFDAVVAGDVIEHLENPSHFLRECNRVLRSDGRLVISTPQANDWWTTMHNWFFRGLIRDPDQGEHLQNWTILDMIRLLKKNGFAIEKLEGHDMRFPKLTLLIPVRFVPILAWQIFYVAKKVTRPDERVLTRVDGLTQNVEQSILS